MKAQPLPPARLHKNSGNARVCIGGRAYWLGKFGSDDADRRYNELAARYYADPDAFLAAPEVPKPVRSADRISVAKLITLYVAHAERYYRKNGSPTPEVSSIKLAMVPLNELFGTLDADDFSPKKLQAVRSAMIARDWARTTINSQCSRIRRMFRWGASEELVDVSVYQSLGTVQGLSPGRTQARESAPVKPVDEHLVNAVLPKVKPAVAAMIRLQLLTAMRPGEVVLMRPCDVDRDGDVWVYTPPTHKTEHHGKVRHIAIGARAQGILAPYLDNRAAEDRCFAYTTAGYRRAIARACEVAKVESWSPNQLRHAAATTIRKTYGLEGAQVVLGHAHARISEVYAESAHERAIAIMAELG